MISKEDVKHVALLARLQLTEAELAVFTEQLAAILEHAGKVAEVDTGRAAPAAHAAAVYNVWREDEVKPCLPREKALLNAPEQEEGAFKVPKII